MATILMAAYTNYARDPRVKREAEAAVAAGHRVTFLACRQPGDSTRATIEGVDVMRVWAGNGKPNSFPSYILAYLVFWAMLSLHLTLHPRRYDLVHINNMPDFLVFAAWLPRALGVPVIHDIHDLMPEIYMEKFGAGPGHWAIRFLRFQERMAGRFATAVLTVEDRLRDMLAARGIPAHKVTVLVNLPDERAFRPQTARLPKGPSEPFVVVYHGTLARRLGLDNAIRAVAELTDALPALRLRIIGAGEERGNLVVLRDELGLGEVVEFSEGFVPVEQIPARLTDADVGIVPLRISGATDIMLPTKLLEYVQMGIPCIVPRTGTIQQYFDDTMVQYVEGEGPVPLAAAMRTLHDLPELRRRLAQNASEKFAAKYRWSEHSRVYVQLIERLLSAKRPAPADTAPEDTPQGTQENETY